jgi:hypothetical protein
LANSVSSLPICVPALARAARAKPGLIDRLRVALDFGKADMTADRGDLVYGAPGLREQATSGLAKPM